MVARGRRGRGRGRAGKISSSASADKVNGAENAINNSLQIDSSDVLNNEVEKQKKLNVTLQKNSRVTLLKKMEEGSNAVDIEDSEPEMADKEISTGKEKGLDQSEPTTVDDPEIEFNVDDTELAEFDTEEADENKLAVKSSDKNILVSKVTGVGTVKAVPSTTLSKAFVGSTPVKQSLVDVNAKITRQTSASKGGTSDKKIKRKFGLDYIVVSVAQTASGGPPSSMRESPHECVLCLPGQAFNATVLAKHLSSVQHIMNVMKLDCPALYKENKNCDDAAVLHSLLSEAVPEPAQPVKLLVVTDTKLPETRNKILAIIKAKMESLNTCTHSEADSNSQGSSSSSNYGMPSKMATPQAYKRSFDEREEEIQGTTIKKSRIEVPQSPEKPVPSNSNNPDILIVGDERAKQMCDVCPALAANSCLSWYPGGRLEKILAGALMRINSQYKVLVVVGLLCDFVLEKFEPNKRLMMVNPDVEELGKIIAKFSNKVKMLNPAMKIIFTIPAYVDFIEYYKKVKRLSKADFIRLEDFSAQVMRDFKRLHEGMRYMKKNTFCFNMNITLRDPSKNINARGWKSPNTATLMQFYPGTLQDGFHMSSEAMLRVANEIKGRAQKMAKSISTYMVKADASLIECWADCDNILIIGDHHTFKFETSAPLDMIKNVTLVTEKFKPMSKLLEIADEMLNPTVDLVIIVGFYREFAQNIINGRYTILEPQVPVKPEIFGILHMYKKKWEEKFPRLTIVFTIPQVVDFFKYNVANNPDIQKNPQFSNEMNIYTHQFSVNIMSFYKELRPSLTLGSRRIWLYHITNSLYEGHESLLPTLGNFSVRPLFPPNSTFDGFKPNQVTAFRMRADLVLYVTKLFRKNPTPKYKLRK